MIVAGSNDGINYTTLATVSPVAPTFNSQIQEFPLLTNSTVGTRYRVTFGPPVSGDRIQVGEMRLFGEAVASLSIRSSGNTVLLSWTNNPGYSLQRAVTLPGSWSTVSTTPLLNGGTNTVTLSPAGTAAYFRLGK